MTNSCCTGMMISEPTQSFALPFSDFITKSQAEAAPVEPPADVVWLVSIEYRKREQPRTLGPFKTKERAIQAVREHLSYWSEERINSHTEYGSDINEGCIYTEEETIETFWRVLE